VSTGKPEYWSKLIAEQEAGKHKIGVFCRERGISEASFYYWRNRLRKSTPVRFALIQTSVATSGPACTLELVLRNGERLRIGDQVAATTLRMVLEVVRG
jgi:hypothetical protein